jgi:hypothetical protein
MKYRRKWRQRQGPRRPTDLSLIFMPPIPNSTDSTGYSGLLHQYIIEILLTETLNTINPGLTTHSKNRAT